MSRGKVGAKRLPHPKAGQAMTFDEWLDGNGGQNKDKFATRQDVVMFSQFALKQEILPMMARAIKRAVDAAEAHRRARVWYRRLWAWMRNLGATPTVDLSDPETRAQLRSALDSVDGPTGPAPEAPEGDGTEDSPDVQQQSCVVCGTRVFMAINERGGVKCQNGHVLEDAPGGDVEELDPAPSPTIVKP